MMLKLKQVALAGALVVSAMPVLAKDVALVIGNRTYRDQPTLGSDVALIQNVVPALERAGFRVIQGQDLDNRNQFSLAAKFYSALKDADRVIVLLGGHMVSNERDSWLLATNAREPNMFSAGRTGLSIGAVLQAAGQKPGGAIVMLAKNRDPVVGFGLNAGLGALDIPQGVTVIQGSAASLVPFLVRGLLKPGRSVATAMAEAPRGVSASGFLSEATPFLPLDVEVPTAPPAPKELQDAQFLYLEAARDIGTIAALEGYLNRFPGGRYRQEVLQEIKEMRSRPEIEARLLENSLKLSREQRRQIQRNLSILGFNPRGIDGVFGRGSRAAIGAWQQARGIEGFGYLTGNQIAALQSTADIRSRELEEEARRRQEEQDRLDAVYWRKTGRVGSEDGLRAYLKRYPDGLYSEIARTRIEAFDTQRRSEAAAAERDFWDQVQANGSVSAYRQYLKRYPQGAFSRKAKRQLDELEGAGRDNEALRRAREDEKRVAGNGIARLLVEQKLQALGLKPGRVDGKFDDNTRRAVRKFQRARQIPVTGFVTQQTIVRLLAAR